MLAGLAPLLTADGRVYCIATNEALGTVRECDLAQLFGSDGYVFSDDWRAELVDLNNVRLTWNG